MPLSDIGVIWRAIRGGVLGTVGTIDLTVDVAQVSVEEFASSGSVSQTLLSAESSIEGSTSLEVDSQVGG